MPARRFAMLPAAGGTVDEMAGLPANPLLPASSGSLVSARTYPILGEIPPQWSTAIGTGMPNFGNPPAWQGTWLDPTSSLQGADLMLSDVISFEVKVLGSVASDYSDIPIGNNTVFQKAGIGVFDTWSNQSDSTYDYSSSMSGTSSAVAVPLQLNIVALKITIRIWDAKTQQARQITIIQDM
jgi:hypothetical protein